MKMTTGDEIKLPLTSRDVNAERLVQFRELFPEASTEGKFDLQKIAQLLGEAATDTPERYGLSWSGKSEAIRAIQTTSPGTLLPAPDESVNFDTTENLIIEGDNLETLKLLQGGYHGRVKMIYIDPPYNTGGEFIYPDNYKEGLADYLKFSGQVSGEGIRLPVRENGERCFDPLINRLTVVASESFKEFAKKLQDEMQKECGVNFENRILNKRERRKGVLKKQRLLDPDFQNLWDKIKRKTRFAVKFSTADLISRCAGELREMPEIKSPFIRREKHELFMTLKEGVFGQERSAQTIRAPEYRAPIPDLLGHLQRETELTRPTLAEILHKSDRLGEVTHNPQQFLEHAVAAIQKSLHDLMVQGIEYERIADAEWEMHRLEVEELESYVSRLLEVQHSIYDVVEFESKVEYEFAKTLDGRDEIKLFFKLPDWFKIETPLGTYNPDWAIVREEPDGQNKVYLVRETKGTTDYWKIPEIQRKKIQCGKAHFKAVGLKDGGYDWVASASEV